MCAMFVGAWIPIGPCANPQQAPYVASSGCATTAGCLAGWRQQAPKQGKVHVFATHHPRATTSVRTTCNQTSKLSRPQRLAAKVLTAGRRLEAAATLEGHVLEAMADPTHGGGSRDVTPLQLVGAGASALSLGALAGFSSHYLGAYCELAAFSAGRSLLVCARTSLHRTPRHGLPLCHYLLSPFATTRAGRVSPAAPTPLLPTTHMQAQLSSSQRRASTPAAG